MYRIALGIILILPLNLYADVDFFCWNSDKTPVQAVAIDEKNVICNFIVLCEPVTDLFKKKLDSTLVKFGKKYDQATDQEKTDAIADYSISTGDRLGKIANFYCRGTYNKNEPKCDPLPICQNKAIDAKMQDPPAMGTKTVGSTVRSREMAK